jgi:hypothetical protein
MSDAEFLNSRIKAAARAQNAFLWVLLALGVFYWSLGSPILSLFRSPQYVSLPVIGIRVPTVAVWGTAPAVLFFILLAVYGTLRVCDEAIAELKKIAPDQKEPDLQANVLDYAIHTTAASPAAVKKLLGFAYPAYLTVFVVEASWLTYALARVEAPVSGRWVLLALAAAQGLLVYVFTVLFWLKRFKRPVPKDRAA